MTRVAIGLGSNTGSSVQVLSAACKRLGDLPGSAAGPISSLYRSAPWGGAGGASFLNGACILETDLSPPRLLEELQAIEAEAGRPRPGAPGRSGSRVLDLDLLTFGQEVRRSPELSVPHPALAFRTFVLVPLSEIDPFWNHPVLRVTAAQLLAAQVPVYDVHWIKHPPWNQP